MKHSRSVSRVPAPETLLSQEKEMPQDDYRSTLTKLAARTFLAMALMLSTANLPAQDARKVITNPAPPYPEVARKFRLTGVVKVQVVIGTDGHIKSVRPIGGHPVLVDAVKETLKDWKYASANSETTTVLEFDFHP
jgi:outer membrane biosynthesis protein TonB